MGDICSHFLMVCSFESMWLGSNGWGCWLHYPDCSSLKVVARSSSTSLPQGDVEHTLDLKFWEGSDGTGRERNSSLNTQAAASSEPEANWGRKTLESREIFQKPRLGLWATSSLQELRTDWMELAFLLYLIYYFVFLFLLVFLKKKSFKKPLLYLSK